MGAGGGLPSAVTPPALGWQWRPSQSSGDRWEPTWHSWAHLHPGGCGKSTQPAGSVRVITAVHRDASNPSSASPHSLPLLVGIWAEAQGVAVQTLPCACEEQGWVLVLCHGRVPTCLPRAQLHLSHTEDRPSYCRSLYPTQMVDASRSIEDVHKEICKLSEETIRATAQTALGTLWQ